MHSEEEVNMHFYHIVISLVVLLLVSKSGSGASFNDETDKIFQNTNDLIIKSFADLNADKLTDIVVMTPGLYFIKSFSFLFLHRMNSLLSN